MSTGDGLVIAEEAGAELSPTRRRRRERLLDAGARQLLRDGYHATTMERIAAEARVSKATLYAYFDDKEALFLAAVASGLIGPNATLARETRAAIERILAALTAAEHDDDLTPAVERLLEVASAGRDDPFPRLMDELASAQPALMSRARSLIVATREERFYAPFEAALASRLPPGLDPELLLHIFYALHAGYRLMEAALPANSLLTRTRWAAGIAALLRKSVRPS